MNGRFAVLGGRIRQDLTEIERIVQRAERAVLAAREDDPNRDLFLDSAALNMHDCYSGFEHLFEQIASTLDQSVPTSRDWHRDLLRQMTVEVAGLRPQVLSVGTINALDEYRRFRHVVRNVYAFELDADRIVQLTGGLRAAFDRASGELMTFAVYLEGLAHEG